MRSVIVTGLVLLLFGFVGALGQAVHAQEESTPVYVQVDYMKVPPGGGAEYVAIEQEIWKAIHQERVKRGLITGWSLYGVWFAPPDIDYDYVTVNVYDDLSKMVDSFSEEIVMAAHPDADTDAMMERTGAAREIIHTEVWQLMDAVQGEEPGNYISVNYMSVPAGGGADWAAMEREVAKPVHEVRVEEGMMKGWAMYGLMMPSGTSMPYNYGTVDSYENFGDIGGGFLTDEVAAKAFPGVSEAQLEMMFASIPETRSIYKSELWQLIDSVSAEVSGSD